MLIIAKRRAPIVAPPSGGGTSYAQLWRDDFDGSALDSVWINNTTAYSPVATIAGGQLEFHNSVGSAPAYGGIGYRRNVPPTGDFYIEAAHKTVNAGGDTVVGTFMGSTNGDTKARIIGQYSGGNGVRAISHNGYSESAAWGSFDGRYADLGAAINSDWLFTRIVWLELFGYLQYQYKLAGGNWITALQHTAIRPTAFGLAMNRNGGGVPSTQQGIFDYATAYGRASGTLITPGTASASSGLNTSTWPYSAAYDGDLGNRWVSSQVAITSASPQWIQDESPTSQFCSRMFLSSFGEGGRDPKDFELLGSNDGGATWVVMGSWVNEPPTRKYQEYTLSAPGSYKIRRLNITANTGGDLVQVSEIQYSG